jgi:hypothetical protein
MLGALYMLLSTPIALAASQAPQSPITTKPPTNPLLTKVADVAPLPASNLSEQPEVVYVPPPPPPVINTAPSGCGDNQYANYIYMHESGCNTTATNYLGCYGIGQSCPASKIAYCGADYACQNAWFTQYANSAYGGWYNAYLFWLNHSWW